MALDTLPPPSLDTPLPDPEQHPPARRRSRTRRILRWVGAVLAVLLLVAGGITWWALDRYVFEHVQISDVDAYEQQVYAEREANGQDYTGQSVTTDAGSTTDAGTTIEPVLTDTSYTDADTSITITRYVTGSGSDQVVYYVADIQVSDVTQVLSAFADNQFGQNIVEDTSRIAADNGALLAINGDYYGFRTSGILIRNGVIYRDSGTRTGAAFTLDGELIVYDETTTTAEELLARGVWQTLSFGPALVDGGQVLDGIDQVEVDTNIGNHSIQGNQPRTGIGMISANHFVFVVVDGRSSESAGMTMPEFAQLFVDLGAQTAYNLDGGGSATMYFNGEVVNNPQGRGDERPVSDILYVTA
ncbi:MAG: phosphodiester glycosidase family protein [Acidimicrobiaceae bacterium]|nr:phosphodiester glycosidase family protein [Acidimicrobiaceae bacterium]